MLASSYAACAYVDAYVPHFTAFLCFVFCFSHSLINNPLMFYIIRFEIIGWYWGVYATCTLDELS